MIIEKGTQKDIDQLAKLYDDINDYFEDKTNYPGWIKGIYPVREQAEDGVKDDALYVVRDNERIAGTIILNHVPEQGYDTVQWGSDDLDYSEIFVIHTLVVHPDYLGKGVGKMLMEFTTKRAKELGMKAIRLDVYENNKPAIALYERSGFKYIDKVDLGLSMHGLDWFKLFEKVL